MTRTVALAGGETVPALGLGTWRMGESRARRARRGGGAAPRAGSRRAADRHRRDVRRRRRGGGGRRGDRGPPRRGLRRQQGLPAQREPARCDRRLRAQPGAAAHRPHRPVPAALARLDPVRADAGGLRAAARRRQDQALGREQPGRGRHARDRGARAGRAVRRQSGLLQRVAPRHRTRPGSVAARAIDPGDGLLSARRGCARARSDAGRDRAARTARARPRSRSRGCSRGPA